MDLVGMADKADGKKSRRRATELANEGYQCNGQSKRYRYIYRDKIGRLEEQV